MKTAAVVLVLLCSQFASGQEPELTPDTPVDSGTLHKWLHSGDPRLIAWAADFSRRNHDAQVIAEIPELLEYWTMPPMAGGYKERAAQRRALQALLDTLIQADAPVPLSAIESVADEFPAQALILIKRIPRASSESTLLNWTFGQDNAIRDRRARAAAMLLAEKPDESFVYKVADGSVQHLTVHVVAPGTGFGGGAGMSCGDSFPIPPEPGWPVVYAYQLTEEDRVPQGSGVLTIAVIGSHSIGELRFDENRAGGECFAPRTEAEFRHELIAYWLGLKPDEMPWRAEESHSIEWTTKSAYRRELGDEVDRQRAKMLDSFAQLRERGLMDKDGAGLPDPRVVVTIECNIDPCPLGKAQ